MLTLDLNNAEKNMMRRYTNKKKCKMGSATDANNQLIN